jgi:hypothetical protein
LVKGNPDKLDVHYLDDRFETADRRAHRGPEITHLRDGGVPDATGAVVVQEPLGSFESATGRRDIFTEQYGVSSSAIASSSAWTTAWRIRNLGIRTYPRDKDH